MKPDKSECAGCATLRAEVADMQHWLSPEINSRKQRVLAEEMRGKIAAQIEAAQLAADSKAPVRKFTRVTVAGIYDPRFEGYWVGGKSVNEAELGPWHPSYSYVVLAKDLEAALQKHDKLAALIADETLSLHPLDHEACVLHEAKIREDLRRASYGRHPGVTGNGASVI